MKPSNRLIAKILTLCGISLTCTACYATPNADFQPPKKDITETVAIEEANATSTEQTAALMQAEMKEIHESE